MKHFCCAFILVICLFSKGFCHERSDQFVSSDKWIVSIANGKLFSESLQECQLKNNDLDSSTLNQNYSKKKKTKGVKPVSFGSIDKCNFEIPPVSKNDLSFSQINFFFSLFFVNGQRGPPSQPSFF